MTQTFEDASFVVEAKDDSGCKVTMTVTVKSDEAKRAYKKAIKSVNKQISIPGFRKGKAPDATITSQYGPHVEREWKDQMIREGVQAGFDLSKIYPMHKELLENPKLTSCDKEEGATMTFSYERYPVVPEVDLNKIDLPSIEADSVSEDQVQSVLTDVRKAHATYETVEKAIELGDYAEITVKNKENGSVIAENRRVEVAEKHIADWLLGLVQGMKAGEEKEGEAEKMAVVVTIDSVQKAVLPEVNEELVKKVGAESEEDLMTKIRKNLEAEAEAEKKRKQIEALEDALLDQYSFELPTSLKDSEREIRLKNKLQELKQTESDEAIKSREEEIEAEVADFVDKSLRLYFLNRQLAKQGKIELSQEEVNAELANQVMRNPMAFQKDMDKEMTERLISQVSAALMERKIKDYALSAVLTN